MIRVLFFVWFFVNMIESHIWKKYLAIGFKNCHSLSYMRKMSLGKGPLDQKYLSFLSKAMFSSCVLIKAHFRKKKMTVIIDLAQSADLRF